LTTKAQFPYELPEAMQLLGWVGGPCLLWRGRLVDGRRRAAACEGLGLSLDSHLVTAHTARDAARRLVAAGHWDRAVALELFPYDPRDVVTCLSWLGLRRPNKPIVSKRVHEPRIRSQAIDRVIACIERAESRGDRSVPTLDLKEIVKRWHT
jgi:hypothetical protein